MSIIRCLLELRRTQPILNFQDRCLRKRTILTSACFIFAVVQCLGQSIQERGFPSPATVEVVFPHIVFGSTPNGTILSEIVLVNQQDSDAYVELDLFDSSGAVPQIRVLDPNSERPLTLHGRYRVFVAARSTTSFFYPERRSVRLESGGVFSGWALLRSQQKLTVYQRIRVLDPVTDEPGSELNFPANVTGLLGVRLLAQANPLRSTGFAFVNPHRSKSLRLLIAVEAGRDGAGGSTLLIDLPPGSKRTMVASELFGPETNVRFVTIAPETSGDVFAFAAIEFGLDSLDTVRRDLLTLSNPGRISRLTGETDYAEQESPSPWNLPMPVTATAKLRDLQILLTPLAVFLQADDGTKLGPFPIYESEPKIVVSADTGIAVVAAGTQNAPLNKPIIFARQRKVVWESIQGYVAEIRDFPEKGQAEIKSFNYVSVGLTAQVSTFLLLDKEKGEVIDRFVGNSSSTPPWRR